MRKQINIFKDILNWTLFQNLALKSILFIIIFSFISWGIFFYTFSLLYEKPSWTNKTSYQTSSSYLKILKRNYNSEASLESMAITEFKLELAELFLKKVHMINVHIKIDNINSALDQIDIKPRKIAYYNDKPILCEYALYALDREDIEYTFALLFEMISNNGDYING
jgi:hypothetical protein